MKRLLLAGLLLTACAPLDPPTLVLEDETRSLNAAALETAAAPLLRHGNTVLGYLVNKGDLEGADLARRLKASGRLPNDQIRSHTVAVYACLSPRYSEFRIGAPWSDAVTGGDLEQIRYHVLNPGLRAKNPQQAYVDSLVRLSEKVDVAADRWHRNLVIFSIVVGAGVGTLFIWWAFVQWPQFAPFRLLAWMWRQTPRGKAEIRRQEQAQLRLHQNYVRNWEKIIDRDRALIGWLPSDLEAQLQCFDAQRQRLDQLDLAQAGNLADETRRLFQRVSELSTAWNNCRTSYQYAAELWEGLRKALGPVKVKGKHKTRPEPCPELDEFESRLGQCKQDGKRDGLMIAELEELTVRQQDLSQQIRAFWKQKEPASWKVRFEPSYTSSTDSYASSYEPPSSTPSSSGYDPNQDQNWSSGSSESRSGGEW